METRIKDLLDAAGMTQKRLAELARLREATVSNAVQPNGNPRLSTLVAIADVLKVPVWQLFISDRDAASDSDITGALAELDDETKRAVLLLMRRRAG